MCARAWDYRCSRYVMFLAVPNLLLAVGMRQSLVTVSAPAFRTCSGEPTSHPPPRHTPAGRQLTVSTQTAGPNVTITVTDTGEGIAAGHLPLIFERFYRADTGRDRAHCGSGIGLTIARALIAAHDGTLTAARDASSTGARFTITLPGAANPG
jgi:hypothetical protein